MKGETAKRKRLIMGAIICVCIVIVCEAGYLTYRVVTANRTAWEEVDEGADDREQDIEEQAAEIIEEKLEELEEAGESELKLEAADVEKLLEKGTLLICVPADSLLLRRKPGLDSTVIAQLDAGEQVIWDGTKMEMDGNSFYRVVVRSTGRMGYVIANSCVEPDFVPENPLEQMDIVETDDALYTYDMMVEDIGTLVEKYPDIVSTKVLGRSLDGRDIYEIILGNEDASHHILAQGAIHGREYMTSQLLMKLVEYYAYYYEEGEYEGISYEELLENTAIHIVPMSNPDGVTISQIGIDGLNNAKYQKLVQECYERDKEYLVYEVDANGNGNWSDYYAANQFDRSKFEHQEIIDFAQYQKIWKANAGGVDLNNNFDAGWEDLTLKDTVSYSSYKGNSPVSEPETKVLTTLATERMFDYYISYHSRGQIIYYDAKGNQPATSDKSKGLAETLQSCLKYEPVNTQKGYNVNLGGFSDWVQLSLNGSSVTIESGKGICPLEAKEFVGMWYRHREAWAKLMKELR